MQPSYQSGFYAPGRGVAKHPELWRGCVGAWSPGLGNTGLVLRDWSGGQNNGVLTNGPTWGVSDGRQALDFDGVNDYVVASNTTSISSTQTTISAYVYFTSFASANPRIIEMRDASNGVQIIRDSSGSGAWTTKHSQFETGISGMSWGAPSTGVWYHTTAVWDSVANTTKFYINGIEQAGSLSNNIGAGNQASKVYIGIRSDLVASSQLHGLIEDVRVYNRALSPNEIRLLAQRPGIAYELARRKTYFIQAATSTSQFYDVLSPLIFAGTN